MEQSRTAQKLIWRPKWEWKRAEDRGGKELNGTEQKFNKKYRYGKD